MNKKIIFTNITTEQFIKAVTELRERGGEYIFQGTVNEKLVTLKGTETHNKLFTVDSGKHGGSRDLTVYQWIHELRRAVT